jgi:hypothetical protein
MRKGRLESSVGSASAAGKKDRTTNALLVNPCLIRVDPWLKLNGGRYCAADALLAASRGALRSTAQTGLSAASTTSSMAARAEASARRARSPVWHLTVVFGGATWYHDGDVERTTAPEATADRNQRMDRSGGSVPRCGTFLRRRSVIRNVIRLETPELTSTP